LLENQPPAQQAAKLLLLPVALRVPVKPMVLSMRNTLIIAVVLILTQVRPASAQYGWAPPNYNVCGVRSCDGQHYRNLRQILHDRRCCKNAALHAELLDPVIEAPAQIYAPNLYVAPRRTAIVTVPAGAAPLSGQTCP
jgi:hypothetical protein